MTLERPRVAHVIYRLAAGGLENGLVNLINQLPPGLARHVVISLTDITDFSARIERDDVELIALNKPAGHGLWCYRKLAAVLRELRPGLVHTRGLAALEAAPLARYLGLPVIHGEHGWDASDPNGTRWKYRLLRKLYRPFVTHYVAVSQAIEEYLHEAVAVPKDEITRIANGVDMRRFERNDQRRQTLPGSPFNDPAFQVVGTVMRMAAVKDPMNLLAAFARVARLKPAARLVMVGEGELWPQVKAAVAASGLAQKVWLPGAREDIAAVMQSFDVFALPSLAEGMSNTVLEAMASRLPVIATRVGGNCEVVLPGHTGYLLRPGSASSMARALMRVLSDEPAARKMGEAGQQRVAQHYSLQAMVAQYARLYSRFLSPAVAQAA
jgi:sugar transferase (PEP-CTERM/EpsH1 system associated)